jgi:hypothetical protein
LSDRDQAVGGRRFRLALQLEGLNGLGHDGVFDEAIRGLAEEDLHRRRVLLEAGRRVHGVAGDETMPDAHVAGDDLTGVHARAVGQPDTPDALELVVQVGEPALHVRRRPDRAEGVVLVQCRQAEDRHHCVANVLLDRAPVTQQRGTHLLEVAVHHLAQRLRVERLAEVRGALQVGEDDRDGLPHLLRRQRRRQR